VRDAVYALAQRVFRTVTLIDDPAEAMQTRPRKQCRAIADALAVEANAAG